VSGPNRSHRRAVRSLTPYLLLIVLVLGTGVGIGLGLSEAPSTTSSRSAPSRSSSPPAVVVPPSTISPLSPPSGPSPPALEQIAFFDPSTGYGLFDQSANGVCETLVGSTTNGGATFASLVPVTSGPCPTGGSDVSALAFDDHGDGFAYGPDLFETHDGGISWTEQSELGTVLDVAALGYSIWMVLEQNCAIGTDCPLKILQSEDGGRTWSPSGAQPAGALEASSSSATGLLIRVSQSSAYLVANPGPNPPTTVEPFWFTDDGGAMWRSGEISCGLVPWAVALSEAPNGTLMAVCAGEPGAGQQMKSVSLSFDGGETWSLDNPCPGSSGQCIISSPLDNGYLGQVDATSASTAYLIGDRSDLLVTHDGGAQWGETPVSDGAGGPTQVIFFNPADGVALAYAFLSIAIWHTSDGGINWTAVIPSVD
jgi:BNR/Asp-box repeat